MEPEDRDYKALIKYIEKNLDNIAKLRFKLLEAGVHSSQIVVYIGDILPRKRNEHRMLPVLLKPDATVFGAQIIVDFRVPKGEIYLTAGELK